ncbi:hypothetical protein ACVNP0_14710 [Staphylococcus aureus]
MELLENISNEISEAQDTYKSLKSKQKELNAVIRELEEQLYVSDEAHDEKLEEIKNEYYTLIEQSNVNNDIRFLKHTIEENEAKN